MCSAPAARWEKLAATYGPMSHVSTPCPTRTVSPPRGRTERLDHERRNHAVAFHPEGNGRRLCRSSRLPGRYCHHPEGLVSRYVGAFEVRGLPMGPVAVPYSSESALDARLGQLRHRGLRCVG